MPEEPYRGSASSDLTCDICRRGIFHDEKQMRLFHWDPKQDKDHQAIFVIHEAQHEDMKRWYQK